MEFELQSKRNISAMFNLVGGTSFGSIIAGALTYPTLLNKKKPKFMTKDVLSRWNKDIPKIFTDDTYRLKSNYKGYMYAVNWVEKIGSKSKYDGKNRE